MAGIGEFLQTFMTMRQLQLQTEDQRLRREQMQAQQTVQGIGALISAAQQTEDPIMLNVLAKQLDTKGVLSYDAGINILQAFTPTEAAQRAGASRRGTMRAEGMPVATSGAANVARETEAANLGTTGMNSQQMAVSNFIANNLATAQMTPEQRAELVSRTATGMNRGDVARSGATAALPRDEQVQAAGIAGGTRMSAAQDASNQLGWSNLRQGERQIIQTGALGEMNIQQDAVAASQAAAARGQGGSHVAQLLATKRQLLDAIQGSKNALTPAMIESYRGALNGINQQLQSAGVPTEGQLPASEALVRPGVFQSLIQQSRSFLGGK